jgi:tetratricopeptide (TPR) repeat protein
MRIGFAAKSEQLARAGLTARAAVELSMGVLSFVTEGDDATGYRISSEIGSQKLLVYMVKEDGAYVIRAIDHAATLGEEALARIGKDDLAGAKRWLDWARRDLQLTGGEDPLSGSPFPRMWNRNSPLDRAKMEIAATALADSTSDNGKVAALFLRSRESATTDAERLNLDLALLDVYAGLEKGEELLALAQRLLSQFPDSQTALGHQLNALRMLKRFTEADRLVDERIARDPSEVYLYLVGAGIASEGGNLARAEELEKKLIAMGKGGSTALNSLAWDYLVEGKNLEEALELSRRSATPAGGFGELHTLASIYAETGKTTEARQVILQAMDASAMTKPDDACWYVFARIAEQFGLTEVARDYYQRLQRPKTDRMLRITTYALAQRRLAGL